MASLAAFLLPSRRVGRASFVFSVPLVLALGVGCAALVYSGRVEAFIGYLVAGWSWLCLHANRCHDAGWSGKPLLLAWPLVLVGALTLGGAVVLVSGVGLPLALPGGDPPPLAYAHASVLAALALVGVDLSGVPAATAVLTAASLPLVVSLLVTVPVAFAPDDPRVNRWGEPAD